MTKSDEVKLTIKMKKRHKELIAWWIKRAGFSGSLEEFVAGAAVAALPDNAENLFNNIEQSSIVTERAETLAEEELLINNDPDGPMPPPIMSSAPQPPPGLPPPVPGAVPLGQPLNQVPVNEMVGGGHPCRFLDKGQTPHFQGQSEGTCRHPSQNGRVCFWAAQTARQCDSFGGKIT